MLYELSNETAVQIIAFVFATQIQANLIMMLSLGSIETDCIMNEPCYNEVAYYRHIIAKK